MNQNAAAEGGAGTSAPQRVQQSLAEPSASQPAASVPDHELLCRIGGGSYGDVWLAKNAVGTLRAVKVVHRKSFDRDEHFEREFRGLQKFEPLSRSHEGFVDVLQLGRNDQAGYFYYVMELADGAEMTNAEIRNPKEAQNPNSEAADAPETIQASSFGLPSSFEIRHSDFYTPRTLRHDLKQRGRLPLADCLQIGRALADALAHLHAQGLVHRDIKPSNIIFVNGAPKLADIGLVTSIDDAHSLVGTVGYIPPEGPGSPQADIYSFGKVLYEAAFGKDRQEFPQLPAYLQSRPDHAGLLELNEVITKACESEPRRRYQSAGQMRADLDLLQRGKSIRRKRVAEQHLSIARKSSLVALPLALLIAGLPLVKTLHQRKSQNPEAQRLYELGRWHYNQLTDEGLLKAIDYMNRAIQVDSAYVPAYASLFEIYVWTVPGMSSKQKFEKERQIASKLMKIDPSLAAAHAALSWVKYGEQDWRGAEQEMRIALKLEPNYPIAHGILGYYLCLLGRAEEAQEHMKRVQELDPTSRIQATVASYPFLVERKYDQALEQLRRVLVLDKYFEQAHKWIAKIYESRGDYLAAIDEFEQNALRAGGDAARVRDEFQALREAYNNSGTRGYWLKVLDLHQADGTLSKQGPMSHAVLDRWNLAAIYARLDEKEQALDVLEQEYDRGEGNDWLRLDPGFENLRDEPRFKALLKRAGLER